MLEHIDDVTELMTWQGEIPVSHLYTAGVAGERFLREIKDNSRFLAVRCEPCNYTYLPPVLFCPQCFSQLEEWREVGPSGVVRFKTAVHLDLDGRRMERPQAVGLIQLDGADGLLVHKLIDDVEAGQRVIAVFKEASARTGSVLDIEYFAAE